MIKTHYLGLKNFNFDIQISGDCRPALGEIIFPNKIGRITNTHCVQNVHNLEQTDQRFATKAFLGDMSAEIVPGDV